MSENALQASGLDWRKEFGGKRVLITGAGGTLGGWLAECFARAGARLGLTDTRADLLAPLDRTHAVIANGGFIHTADLTDGAGLQGLTACMRQYWTSPDIVINNAGIYPTGDLLETSDALWDQIFAVNLRATFIISRNSAQMMIADETPGVIINIASGGSRVLRPGLVPYCVSKSAVERLTKGFALELGQHQIRVNAVSPGFMPQQATPADAIAAHARATPMQRHAMPGDATTAILYLCSSAASFVTGTMIDTDGGYHMTAAAISPSANANNVAHRIYGDNSATQDSKAPV